jgi:hypothetical protein
VKILSVTVGGLANANASSSAKHAVDFSHEPFRFFEETRLTGSTIERNKQDQTECVRPKIAKSIWPDALVTHPTSLFPDEVQFAEHAAPLLSGAEPGSN